MIDMTENSFRSRLLSKDKQGSLEYLKTNLAEEKLVSALHDLIFFSVLVITLIIMVILKKKKNYG